MFNGLPGTGIGGMFYLLSAIVMVTIEFTKKVAQFSVSNRWKDARLQFIIISGITLALTGSAMLLDALLTYVLPARGIVSTGALNGGWIFSVPRVIIPILILATILGGGEALRMLLARNTD